MSASHSAFSRDMGVDTARGLACILLVTFHVVGATPEHGIRAADDSFARMATEVLSYVRMPLFTLLSGVVYALKPVREGGLIPFARGKTYRIALPFVIATSLYFIASVLVDRSELIYGFDLWVYFVRPFMHLWFLQAILVLFAIIALLDYFRLLSSVGYWACGMAAAVLGMILVRDATTFMSLDRALDLAPFFLLGVGITRFPELMRGRRALILGLVASVAGLMVAVAQANGSLALTTWEADLARLAAGGGAPIAFFNARISNQLLARIGQSSLIIYLYHVAAIGGSRRMMESAGMDGPLLLFSVGLVVGLAAPVAFEWIAARHTVTRLLFLGLRPSRTGAAV